MDAFFLNAAYALLLLSLTVRDILWLRSIFLTGTICFLTYALITDNHVMSRWNVLFLLVNTGQLIRLIRERRPIALPEDIAGFHRGIFKAMTTREFLFFWEMGHTHEASAGEKLVTKGRTQDDLSLILNGSVAVQDAGRELATLGEGKFVAEMSFLTSEAASADVTTVTAARIHTWNQRKLESLKTLRPDLFVKIQNVLGADVSRKLRQEAQER